jgi:hypothetical protein
MDLNQQNSANIYSVSTMLIKSERFIKSKQLQYIDNN